MNMDDPFAGAGASDTKPRVALIAGPTASGKSGLAVGLAQSVEERGQRTVIINADASQVYRDLAIVSARPNEAEMGGIDHRMFGHIDGADDYNAARWAEEAKAEIAAAHSRGAVSILVGGTGMYIRTLLEGIAPVPDIDPEIRARIRSYPVAQQYEELQRFDSPAAARLNPRDTTRISRALEVTLSTGRPLAEWQKERVGGIGGWISLIPQILLPPRDALRLRCDARFAAMLDQGAAIEVESLLARGLSPERPVMRAIGVPEIAAMLDGSLTRDEALSGGQLATRQYAKRQYTWFRNQLPGEWPRFSELLNSENISQLAIKLRNDVLTG